MTKDEKMRMANIAVEAAKILKDYPHLSIEQAIEKAKELFKEVVK